MQTNVGSPSYTPPELLMATRNEGATYDGGLRIRKCLKLRVLLS